jgi:DnaJ-class molecular chaperone
MSLYSIWDSYYPGPRRKQAEITAYENRLAALDDDCVRLVSCDSCGGEGQFYTSRHGGNDPDVYPTGEECPWCRGDGMVWVEALPIEMEDLQ